MAWWWVNYARSLIFSWTMRVYTEWRDCCLRYSFTFFMNSNHSFTKCLQKYLIRFAIIDSKWDIKVKEDGDYFVSKRIKVIECLGAGDGEMVLDGRHCICLSSWYPPFAATHGMKLLHRDVTGWSERRGRGCIKPNSLSYDHLLNWKYLLQRQ